MSTLMDGIGKIQLYNTQIEQLKAMDSNNPADVSAALYSIEKSFNEMLNKFMSTNDDDDDSNSSNMFNFLIESNQQTLNNILALQNNQQ